MLRKRGFFLFAMLLVIVGLAVYLNRPEEVKPAVAEIIPATAVVPEEKAPAEVQNDVAVMPSPAKRETKFDTKPLEPCFSYWTQQHRVKYFDKKSFPNKEISIENQAIGNLPKIICNLKVRNEYYSVMLATEPSIEKLVEITEAWLKPSGDELEVYRPDGSAFKKNQVLGFWGALELDHPSTSVKIKYCGAELGWGLQCPKPQ